VPRRILERSRYSLILFGSGMAPLPTTTPELFATRIGYVLLAVGYTLCVSRGQSSAVMQTPKAGSV
jgi:hypothetical protein